MEFEISKKFIDKSRFMKIDEVDWSKVRPGTAFCINTICNDDVDTKLSVCYSYIFIEYIELLDEIQFYHTVSGNMIRMKLIAANKVYNFTIDDFREDDLNKIPTIYLDDLKWATRCVVFKDAILHGFPDRDEYFFKTSNYNPMKNTCDLINFKRKFKLRNVKVDFLTSAANIFIRDDFTTEDKVTTDVDRRFKLIIRTDESRGNKIVIVKKEDHELWVQVIPKSSFTPEIVGKVISSSIIYILTNKKYPWNKKLLKEGERYYRIDYNTFEIQNAAFSLDNPESLYDVYLNNVFLSPLDIEEKNGVEKVKANINFNDGFFGLNLANKRKEEENNEN